MTKIFNKMKSLMLVALITVLIISLAAPALGASIDEYTYKNETFNFTLTMPGKYKDEVTVDESNNWIKLIHNDSFSAGAGGDLFSIIVINAKDTDLLNSVLEFSVGIVEETDKYAYVLYLPTDVRFSNETSEEYLEIYNSLVLNISGVRGLAPNVFNLVDPNADTPSSWAEADVNKAIAANIVPVALQSKYTDATTRAEFCALAVALYETVKGAEITERAQFDDTTDVNVQKMAALDVVNGIGNNKFDPNAELTREQAATMLSRLATAIGKPLAAQAPTFVDSTSVSTWAFDEVGQMQAAGIMDGVGGNKFSPATDYTREQSIVTTLRLFDIVK